jgi:hypothetical protein
LFVPLGGEELMSMDGNEMLDLTTFGLVVDEHLG